MLHTFPRWKYALLAVILVIGLIYALPNLYGEDPAVQIISVHNAKVDAALESRVADILKQNDIKYKSIALSNDQLLVRFFTTDVQLSTRDLLMAKNNLGDDYSIALNLAPVTPHWLTGLGAEPMKLGLDLRGGVRFLMEVDVASNIKRRLESNYNDLRGGFRQEKIHYSRLVMNPDNTISVEFESKEDLHNALDYIHKTMPNMVDTPIDNSLTAMKLQLSHTELEQIRSYTMEQTAATLRNRVNELGVAEAIIQQQGVNRVVVELPGIQDTARAKDILGKTATLDFLLEDSDNDLAQAAQGRIPPGSKLMYLADGRPVLLKNRVILTGDSIVGASSQYGSQDNKPVVAVHLGGGGISLFKETTMNNIGKRMAVLYRESHMQEVEVDGKKVKQPVSNEKLISYATIESALGNNFQISGMSLKETRELALLLRAGALPATISIVEERIIGPSMGQENIDKGILSVVVGFCLIISFMTMYYSVFGIIANIALLFNLILLVALMSLVGATLTLPGIAGIVLTLGMAVDANVLIFERIREEMRLGMSPHACIQRGFEHAFSTIIDSNLTTLIVGVILFTVGSGPVKGFAITLSLGILTSLFTAITGTRAIIELVYGKRRIEKLSVGI
jgi:preprotein translocase subunit SecD